MLPTRKMSGGGGEGEKKKKKRLKKRHHLGIVALGRFKNNGGKKHKNPRTSLTLGRFEIKGIIRNLAEYFFEYCLFRYSKYKRKKQHPGIILNLGRICTEHLKSSILGDFQSRLQEETEPPNFLQSWHFGDSR